MLARQRRLRNARIAAPTGERIGCASWLKRRNLNYLIRRQQSRQRKNKNEIQSRSNGVKKIQREGKVSFGDASLTVWEESIIAARDRGGYAADEDWRREFKREVFARIIRQLKALGWAVMPNKYIFTGPDNRYCRKGELRADLKMMGRCIQFEMFQNVNAPKRPDHAGRYESDKEALMPYLMRLEMERTRRRIRNHLCIVFEGYAFAGKRQDGRSEKRGPGALTAMQYIAGCYETSWHFKGDLSKYEIASYNSKSAEGLTVTHGARVWGFGRISGRAFTGIAYYNINNMWWVATGKYDVRNEHSGALYVTQPDNLRKKRNGDRRRRRVEEEMQKEIKAMNFERCAVLRKILFPAAEPLYMLYHTEHKAYHGPCFSGYSEDPARAGLFTYDEVKGWENKTNKIVPLEVKAA
jgi:hypothetical protein